MKAIIVPAFVVMLMIIGLVSCDRSRAERIGGPYYFSGWGGYQVQLVPIDEITEAEALTRDIYYVAYFNDQGRLEKLSAFRSGKEDWVEKYRYKSGKLVSKELREPDGTVKVSLIDENGRIVEID